MTSDMTLLSQFEEKGGHLVIFRDDNIGTSKGYDNLKFDNPIIKNVTPVEGLKHI